MASEMPEKVWVQNWETAALTVREEKYLEGNDQNVEAKFVRAKPVEKVLDRAIKWIEDSWHMHHKHCNNHNKCRCGRDDLLADMKALRGKG